MSGAGGSLLPAGLSFTKLSRGLALLLAAGYGLQLVAPKSRQYLALVAGRFIPCVWTVFTAGFLETSLLQLLFSAAALLVVARIVEPIWGSKEFLKFLAIVNLGTGCVALAVLYVWYIVSTFRERAGRVLYMEVCGFHGCVAGCLVAVKQLIPDTEVTLLRVLRFQARHLPALYLLACAGASLWLGGAQITIPYTLAGAATAWVYLRFLQGKPGLNLRGDPSNEFRLATFFPEALHPAVDAIARICGRAAGIAPSSESGEGRAAAFVLQAAPLPGADSADSARRRERGAKVLEERLTGAPLPNQEGAAAAADVEAPAPQQSEQPPPDNGAK